MDAIGERNLGAGFPRSRESGGRSLALLVVLGLLCLSLFSIFRQPQPAPGKQVAFSDFLDQVEAGVVAQVTFRGRAIYYVTTRGESVRTYAPEDPDLIKLLRAKHVKIIAEPEESAPLWMTLAMQCLPVLLLIAVWFFYLQSRDPRRYRGD
jgi:cell division protease FtsH